MRFKAVLFDLDGTLFDTAPDIMSACNRTLEAFGYLKLSSSRLRPKVGLGMRAMMREALMPEHWDKCEIGTPMYEYFSKSYINHVCEETKPYKGIEEIIETLHEGSLHLGVVSNKYRSMIASLFSHFPFTAFFECVLGADSCAHAKPHPEPILRALQMLNVAPDDAVYCGDSASDIIAANRAGCVSCAVKWGYSQIDEEFDQLRPDFIISSPEEILKLISKD